MSTDNATRAVIPDVPKIGFWPATRCPEDLPFAACMRVLAQFLGDTRFGCQEARPEEKSRLVPCASKFFVGLSGIGFAMNWKWERGGLNVLNLDQDPGRHIRRCFEALGLEVTVLANPVHALGAELAAGGVEAATAEEIRRALCASIDRGMPCLAFGVFPPPEACLVTGYDEGGDVLIGWSQFQDFPEWKGAANHEASGYFRRSDWAAATACVAIPGERLPQPPPLQDLVYEAVQTGLRLMERDDVVHGFVSGIRGYQALIDALRDAAAFPAGDDVVLRQRFQVINGIAGDIAEAKCYVCDFLALVGHGSHFLLSRTADPLARDAARERLERAVGRFLVIHDLMWRVWEAERGDSVTLGWPVDEHRYLAEAPVRERIAKLFEAAKAAETEAHDYLAQALPILDGSAAPVRLADPVILPRVPYVGFDVSRTGGKPKTTYMAAALEALLAAVGDPYPYHQIMGASGAAFRLCWNAERWDGGNISTLWMDEDPLEHYRRAFAATGWSPRFLGNRLWKPPVAEPDPANPYLGPDYLGETIPYSADEGEFRDLVRWGVVDRGYPLLSIGAILPPEAGVVCGYGARENVLIGYHHFQVFPEAAASPNVSFDAEGRYVKRNWFRDTLALIGLQHKGPKPPVEKTFRDALGTAVHLIRTPRFRRHYSGLAAYRAWAEALDSPWSDGVLQSREEMDLRLMCHNDAIACLLDGRVAAEEFMREAASVLPAQAEALLSVASLYGDIVALTRRMIAIQGGFRGDPAPLDALARATTRRELAATIREAAAIEERIAVALAAATAKVP